MSTATAEPRDRARTPALAITTGVTALLTAAGLLSLWVAPPPDADLLLVIWTLVFGAGFAAAARAVLGSERASIPGRLFLLSATLLLIAPLARAAGQPVVAQVSVVLATRVLPVALATALGVGVGMFCAGWLQFELTTGDQRRQLLWIIFGVCASVLIVALLVFVVPESVSVNALAIALTVSVLSLGIPLTATIALLAPRALEVRAVISSAVVFAVMLALVTAVYFGVQAGFAMQTGQPLAGDCASCWWRSSPWDSIR
ncbi:MAG: hypothetical protein ACRDTH_03500 [Pseudonocardiaceae bacterium]